MSPEFDREWPFVPQVMAPRGTLTTGGYFSMFPRFSLPRKYGPPILTKLKFSSALKCGLISDCHTFR